MEKVVVIEVGEQQGKIVERFRATSFPVRIGRAYDNDLIVTDPYVCPHHCEVVLGEGGEVVVNDLSSVNGTFVLGDGARASQVKVGPDSRLRIGHTQLHFKLPGQRVEPTLVDVPHQAVREWPPRSLLGNLAVLLLGALLMTLWDYLGSYNAFEYGKYFFGQQIPALIAVAGWAAVWSVVSRITSHRFAFFRHATIVVSAILIIAASAYLLDFLKFGFAINWPFEIINTAIIAMSIALLLYWHLRLCSDQKRRRLMTVATIVSVVLVGLAQVNDFLDSQEFRSGPVYSTTLKPPVFQMVKSKPVDDFLSHSEQLKSSIEREIKAQRVATAQASTDSRPE